MEKIPGSALGHRSFGLDLARAVAIGLVILSHFSQAVEGLGFWGVELFFGLSGFLIGQILWKSYSAKTDWSFKHITNFWSRRWWRTLPNYFLFLFIMLFFHKYFQNGLPPLSLFLKHLWFGQDLLSRNGSFFGVAWSLCIEEWFYLLFPLFLFTVSKAGFKRLTSFSITLAIIFIGSFLVREMLISHNTQQIRGITLARLDAIGWGVFVTFLTAVTKSNLTQKWLIFVSGIVILMGSVYIYYFANPINQHLNTQLLLIFTPMGFSLTLPLVGLIPKSTTILRYACNAVEKISLWSYSIYLCHIPVLFIVYKLLINERSNPLINFLSKVLGLGIAILISAFIYKYVEVPLMKKRPAEIKD